MAEETLETAARRLVRFVRIDDHQHGGLLSRDTLIASDTLDKQVKKVEAERKAAEQQEQANAQIS
jgi:hypothetical protein